jgi:exodeoxyribonuclease V beta subunit
LAQEDPLATLSAAVDGAWIRCVAAWRAERAEIVAQLMHCADALSRSSYKPALIDRACAQWDAVVAAERAFSPFPADSKLQLFRRSMAQPTARHRQAGVVSPPHPFFDAVEDWLVAREALAGRVDVLRAELLRDLLADCLPRLQERKRVARIQTFDDLLADLHAGLQGPHGETLANQLRSRFPVALVDEFQDTDPLQLAILQRIYVHAGKGLFLVGDPKQAIYAFRNADLDSYLVARASVDATGTLASNQRASPELIQALNFLFGCNPAPFLLPELRYTPVAVGARPRPRLEGDDEPRAALQVWLLPERADGGPMTATEARQQVAASCADEIVRLLQAALQGRLQLGSRPLVAGDIAVLVRSHADGRLMRSTLAARGVASVELSQASIFASLDAEEVQCLLLGVADPADPGRVLAAAATSLLGWSAAGIEDLRHDQSALAGLMLDFGAALARWHARGFGIMFGQLLQHFGVAARLLAHPDGARRLTNLRHLAELLQQAATEHPAPEALLRWLLQRIDAPLRDDEQQLRLDSDARLVQIVTVHRAKGLEYPVVFCPALWTAARNPGRDPFGVREYHRSDGQACIDYRPPELLTAAEDAEIRAGQARASFAEQLRLIYVALTRASTRCYLVAGAWSSARSNATRCKAAGATPLNWLAHPASPELAEWQARGPEAAAIEADWGALAAAVADPAVIAVARLPADRGRALNAPAVAPERLQARAAPEFIAPRRRIGSYSGLVSGPGSSAALPSSLEIHFEGAGRDHDGLTASVALPAVGGSGPSDILAFPRGAEAGTCLHALLERVDFADPAGWPGAIESALREQAPWLATQGAALAPARLVPMLERWLVDLAAAPLPGGFCLADLDPRRRLHEMEFHLPAAALAPAALRALLRRHGHAAPALRFDTLHGHLKGFIDLVCEHRGRWYVLDWKSNHLGNGAADYHPERVQAAVDQHDYALQALIYLLALDRFLACRLADYDPRRHLGGALYLFVRGVRPGWEIGAELPAGVWFLPAPHAALADLAAVLNGQPGGAGA